MVSLHKGSVIQSFDLFIFISLNKQKFITLLGLLFMHPLV